MHNLVIIPTYNEKENIALIISEIRAHYPAMHILVVDDSSPDQTADMVKEIMSEDKNVKLLLRTSKNGLGEAYKAALQIAIQDKEIDNVFTMDADGSHNVLYLQPMMKALKKNDLVIGSRYVKGGGVENWEFWRRLLSRGGNIYSRFITGAKIWDLTAGFIGIRRHVLERMDFSQLHSSGYAYQIEFKCYCLFNIQARFKEVPIIFRSRRNGESKMSQQIISEGVLTPLRILWKKIIK